MPQEQYILIEGHGRAVREIEHQGQRYYDIHKMAAVLAVSRGLAKKLWDREGSGDEIVDYWHSTSGMQRIYYPKDWVLNMLRSRLQSYHPKKT